MTAMDARVFAGSFSASPVRYKGRKMETSSKQAKMVESCNRASESFAGRSGVIISRALIDAYLESPLSRCSIRNMEDSGKLPKFPHPSALDLLIEQYGLIRQCPARTATRNLWIVPTYTLEHMAHGGVYDQLAGWIPSLLCRRALGSAALREDVSLQLGTAQELRARLPGSPARSFFAEVARDIIRWMDEWLSDQKARRLLCVTGRGYLDG